MEVDDRKNKLKRRGVEKQKRERKEAVMDK